jgi:tripartite-type tricarboxylate transporter receptor subunit TctC
VSKAPPDGHTLLAYGAPLWIAPLLQNAPYDPIADFASITLVSAAPNLLVVHPQLAASSVKELISLAKAKPGELNYSSSSTGASPHLAAELFKSMAGVNIVRVPYKTTATEIADLIGGQVQLAFGTVQSVMPHVKSGRLRSLAVTSAQPTVLFPGLPTVAMTLPGYESVSMLGVFAPVKTPAAIVNRLNQEIVRVLGQTEIRDKFTGIGVDVIASSPQEFTAKIKSEIARMGKVIKDAGIKAD